MMAGSDSHSDHGGFVYRHLCDPIKDRRVRIALGLCFRGERRLRLEATLYFSGPEVGLILLVLA